MSLFRLLYRLYFRFFPRFMTYTFSIEKGTQLPNYDLDDAKALDPEFTRTLSTVEEDATVRYTFFNLFGKQVFKKYTIIA